MSKPIEDTVMKNIMELFRGDAVKFFGINKRVVSSARTEFTHIPILKKIDDWLWELEDGSYLHIEFQSGYHIKDLPRFMISDAILHYQTGKPVKTIVVYSADIENVVTALDADAIKYKVDAFYMSALDGDKTYADIKAKVDAGESLTKQDLMSIVFLPMMKNSVDKTTRFEQVILLSKEITAKDEQAQIQAMLQLLAEKFVADQEILRRLKEMISVGIIAEWIKDDATRDLAKNALREGLAIEVILKITGLDEPTILELKSELEPA